MTGDSCQFSSLSRLSHSLTQQAARLQHRDKGTWQPGEVVLLMSDTPEPETTDHESVAMFRARGIPNIVQEPGDYAGVYAGFGFETQLSESVSMGPELSLMPATMEGGGSDFYWVPQLNWHITWGF